METQTPPKFRDLSSRYGKNGAAIKRDPSDVIPAIGLKHPYFLLIASLAFAGILAELMFFAATYYGNNLGAAANVAAVAGTFIVAFGGFYLSFSLPHRLFKHRFEEYSPIVFLVWEWVISVIIVLILTAAALVLGIFLVNGELGAVGEILRSLALYAMTAIFLYHGLVMYVRYVRYLYEREMHQSYKIVAFAGVLAVIVLVLALYLLQFDLGRMGGNQPNQGWLALHLSIRDVALISMTMYVFAWHATVLADH